MHISREITQNARAFLSRLNGAFKCPEPLLDPVERRGTSFVRESFLRLTGYEHVPKAKVIYATSQDDAVKEVRRKPDHMFFHSERHPEIRVSPDGLDYGVTAKSRSIIVAVDQIFTSSRSVETSLFFLARGFIHERTHEANEDRWLGEKAGKIYASALWRAVGSRGIPMLRNAEDFGQWHSGLASSVFYTPQEAKSLALARLVDEGLASRMEWLLRTAALHGVEPDPDAFAEDELRRIKRPSYYSAAKFIERLENSLGQNAAWKMIGQELPASFQEIRRPELFIERVKGIIENF